MLSLLEVAWRQTSLLALLVVAWKQAMAIVLPMTNHYECQLTTSDKLMLTFTSTITRGSSLSGIQDLSFFFTGKLLLSPTSTIILGFRHHDPYGSQVISYVTIFSST
jgi:hypothetical protein